MAQYRQEHRDQGGFLIHPDLLATRFREGDRLLCDGTYRSRATTQAWVVACACRDAIRMLDVQAALTAVPGGGHAARKFRVMCADHLSDTGVTDARRTPPG